MEVDQLPGSNSVYITDFTSIAGKTQNDKNCNIPFLYNNAPSYFCALNQSRFVCEVDQANNFDYCNLGKTTTVSIFIKIVASNCSNYSH